MRTPLRAVVLNIAVLAGLWVLTFIAVRGTAGSPDMTGVFVVAGTAVALFAGIKLRVPPATYVAAAVLAFHVATFGMRALFGSGTVQGRGNHLAVLFAAAAAVILTVILRRYLVPDRAAAGS